MSSFLTDLRSARLASLALCIGSLHFSANATPMRPVPTSPVGDVNTASPQFVWQEQSDVDKYRLRLHDRSLRRRIHVQNYNRDDICSDGVCTVQPDVEFGFSSDHAWYLRALNKEGKSLWVRSRFHYRATAPAAVALLAPSGLTESSTPEFSWAHKAGIEGYRLHVRDMTDGKNLLLQDYAAADHCTETQCRITVTDLILPEGHDLFFRVRGENSGGRGDWSEANHFEVSAAAAVGRVTISELVASNQSGLTDSAGYNSD